MKTVLTSWTLRRGLRDPEGPSSHTLKTAGLGKPFQWRSGPTAEGWAGRRGERASPEGGPLEVGPPVRQVAELETSLEEVGTRSCRNLGALTQSLGFILRGWEPMEDFPQATVVISAASLSTHCAVWQPQSSWAVGQRAGRAQPSRLPGEGMGTFSSWRSLPGHHTGRQT